MDISLLMTAVCDSTLIFFHTIKFIIKNSSIITDIKQQKEENIRISAHLKQ